MRYGILRVTTPDGQHRDYPLNAPSVTLGSSSDNAVVIANATVGARHARLTIDSGMPVIEDLGSEAGVYVGNRRLAQGERVLIGSEPIRLGGVQVSYQTPEAAAASQSPAAPVAASNGGSATVPVSGGIPGAQRLALTLTGPAAPVEPGGVATATLEVQNRSSTVEEVTFAFEGPAAAWAEVPAAVVALLPGARQQVSITLRPPRSADTHAGTHGLVAVVRQRSTGEEYRSTASVIVTAFQGFAMSLGPVRSNRDFRVTLENAGNSPATVSLRGEDDEAAMVFDFDSIDVTVPPGGKQVVPLRVRLPGSPKFGREQVKPFRVEARTAGSAGQTARAAGQLRIKPPLEAFKLPVILLAVIAGLAAGGVTYATRCESWGLPGCRDNGQVIATGTTPGVGETPGPGETPDTPATQQGNAETPATGETTEPTEEMGGETPPTETETPPTTENEDTPTPPSTVETETPTEAPPTTVVTPQPGHLTFPAPKEVLDPDKNYVAVVTTNIGAFRITLDVRNAYETSNSFAFLAMEGFFDDMEFEFGLGTVSAGDTEGEMPGTAGYTIEAEYTEAKNTRGTVGMVPLQTTAFRSLRAPIEVGSHWFVNVQDNLQHDTGGILGVARPVFGSIGSGMDVVEKLGEGDVIEQIEISELTIRPRPGLGPILPGITPVVIQ